MATLVTIPKLGLTMASAVLVEWKVREGEPITRGQHLADIETDKINHELEAPASGVLLKTLLQPGDEAPVLAPIAVIGEPGEDIEALIRSIPTLASAAATAPEPDVAPPADTAAKPDARAPRPTPRARKLMREHNVPLSALATPGLSRITEADVQAYLDRSRAPEATPAPVAEAEEELVPMTGAQKRAARRLTACIRETPQFSLRFVVDMRHALAVRSHWMQQLHRSLSINDLLLRGVVLAIARNPDIQLRYTPDGLRRPNGVHLGLATATPAGLLVPVIHHAEQLKIEALASAAADLVERARAGRLGRDDVTGGTFTVSNLGMYGITSFVPIVNPGESAILGVGALHEMPKVENGALGQVAAIECTLVCDHRALDGARAAEFCRTLKETLEQEPAEAW